jgi:Raf kinase inhibitor-like YbhB/YbcL family protein
MANDDRSAINRKSDSSTEIGTSTMSFAITSAAFSNEGEIPTQYTCEGDDCSPELEWKSEPPETKTFVLIVDDPDAPDPKAPKMTWVHWVLFNIPASTHMLPEAVATTELPAGTGQGINNWKRTGYGGPCPPIGRHRYFFKLYAVDTELTLDQPTKAAVVQAMKGHILAEAVLMGTYEKKSD